MAAPTYATDLGTLNLSTGTWGEFTGAASGSAPTENDSDNFIAGTDSTTEAVRNSGASSMYAPANTTTIASGDAVFMWLYFAAMPNMATFANDGYQVAIGSGTGAYDKWTVAGRDTLPYGGWFSVAVDPTATPTNQYGGGSSGTHTYFGSVINLDTGIAKGNAFANDYQREGRSLIVTVGDSGTPGTFTGAAAYNDDVTRRWGLFAAIPGGFTQKGLFQMGSASTAVYFSEANVNIVIEDTIHCAAGFNEFEILNTGSTVILTGVQISALGTQSPGLFTVTDNATVTLTGCTFNDMGAFTLQSGTSATESTFRRCGQIEPNGADLSDSTLVGYEGTADTGYINWDVSTDPNGKLDNCAFTKGTAATHAIEFDATNSPTTMTLVNHSYTDYGADDSTSAALYFKRTSGTVTVNYTGDLPTVKDAGCTVDLVSSTTVTFTGMKDNTEVRVYKTSDDSVVDGTENATTGTTDDRSFAWAAAASLSVYYVIHNLDYETIRVEGYVVPGTNTSLPIQQRLDRNYENP